MKQFRFGFFLLMRIQCVASSKGENAINEKNWSTVVRHAFKKDCCKQKTNTNQNLLFMRVWQKRVYDQTQQALTKWAAATKYSAIYNTNKDIKKNEWQRAHTFYSQDVAPVNIFLLAIPFHSIKFEAYFM